MNLETLISIVACATGGGCLLWIYYAGQWKGQVDSKLNSLENRINETIDGVSSKVKVAVGGTAENLSVEVSEALENVASNIRTEFSQQIVRVHERLDQKQNECRAHLSEQQTTDKHLQGIIEGLKLQRQEWDTLRSDVRNLLRSEATTTNEVSNLKERLASIDQKITNLIEKLARMESDVSHLNSDRRR